MSTVPKQLPAKSGYHIYQGAVLRAYDFWVHGISNPWFWGFSTRQLHELYQDNLTANHFELGVGTAKFLALHFSRSSTQRLVVADASDECLCYSQRRLQSVGIRVTAAQRVDLNLPLDGLVTSESGFSSVGLNYVLHCLPTQESKQRAIELSQQKLAVGGCLFGSTLLGLPASRRWRTRQLERFYQAKGIFHNQKDSSDLIEHLLKTRFGKVELRRQGRALMFVAHEPLR